MAALGHRLANHQQNSIDHRKQQDVTNVRKFLDRTTSLDSGRLHYI